MSSDDIPYAGFWEGALDLPLVFSNSFVADPETSRFSAADMGGSDQYFYARWSNPTVRALERELAEAEGGEEAVCFATGMAAISALLISVLSSGEHVVMSDVCYAGVTELARDTLRRMGIGVSFVDTSSIGAVEAAIGPKTRLIYVETPANPILRLCDLAALAAVASARGVLLAVDSTIATPIATRPLGIGADYVIHSLSKYIGGHGDALGGVIVCSAARAAKIRSGPLVHLGGALSPMAAWIIRRGLATLSLRMARHESNAMAVARYLSAHRRVGRVIYPGLTEHPQHDLAKRQMRNFSGLISFSAEGGAELAEAMHRKLRVVRYAVSLGKHVSLIFHLPTEYMTSGPFAEAPSYSAWAGDGLFRFSVGLESPERIIEDLERALGPN